MMRMLKTEASRRRLAVAGAVLAFAAASGGCVLDGAANYKRDLVLTGEHDAATGLEFEGHNGSITVRRGELPGISISATVRATTQDRADGFSLVLERGDGVTRIVPRWPDDRRLGNEGVTVEIELAGASSFHLESSNGRITVTDLSGELRAESSNGRIEVRRHDGPIRVETSNGRVEIEAATGEVMAETSNGRVVVSLADESDGPVRISTSNGSVSLDVGDGIAGTLNASTSNGSITLMGPDGQRVKRNDSVSLMFGSPGGSSRISTSNGSVSITSDEGEMTMGGGESVPERMPEQPASDL